MVKDNLRLIILWAPEPTPTKELSKTCLLLSRTLTSEVFLSFWKTIPQNPSFSVACRHLNKKWHPQITFTQMLALRSILMSLQREHLLHNLRPIDFRTQLKSTIPATSMMGSLLSCPAPKIKHWLVLHNSSPVKKTRPSQAASVSRFQDLTFTSSCARRFPDQRTKLQRKLKPVWFFSHCWVLAHDWSCWRNRSQVESF